jgi:RNA polymerase sigma factor (sigma-70 family)
MSSSGQEKGSDVLDSQERERFEQLVLPHLDAAFNLARWLLRSRADAEDVAQEAMLRAYRFFGGFHGGDARAWLLQIVRNTGYTWL